MKKLAALFIITQILLLVKGQEESYFLNGVASYQNQEYNTAIEQLNKSIELDKNSGKSILYRGRCNFLQGNLKSAESDFLTALKLNLPEASLDLSKLYAKEGNTKQTIKYIKEYINSAPNVNTIALFKSKHFTKLNKTDEWFEFISEFTHLEKWELLENISYLTKSGKYAEAYKYIDQAISDNPDDVEFQLAKSELYEIEGNFALAAYEVGIAKQKFPYNVKILNSYVRLSLVNGKYEKAIEGYVQLKKLKPENFDIRLELAKAYLLNNEKRKALAETKSYLNFFPHSKTGNFRLAECYFAIEDYTSTLKCVNKLIHENKNAIESEWYLLRGKTYFQTHTYKYAAQDLSMCLDLTPHSKDANYYLGLAHLEMNDRDLACYYLHRAYKLGDNRAFKHMQNCK